MRLLVVALCLCAVLFASSAAFAQTDWAVPPPFTVQRDIAWNLVPGTTMLEPTYYGPDDPYLKDSDFIKYDDNVSVFGDWIGVDNSNGQEGATGSILFHIDNWDMTWPVKLIWLQADAMPGDGGSVALRIYDPAGHNVPWNTEYVNWDPSGLWGTQVVSAHIQPNPVSEDFLFTFDAPPGGAAGIRNLRIATYCGVVPEPSTVIAVCMFLAPVGLVFRRKRKS